MFSLLKAESLILLPDQAQLPDDATNHRELSLCAYTCDTERILLATYTDGSKYAVALP